MEARVPGAGGCVTGQDASACDGFMVLWDRDTSKEKRAQGQWDSAGGALPLSWEWTVTAPEFLGGAWRRQWII